MGKKSPSLSSVGSFPAKCCLAEMVSFVCWMVLAQKSYRVENYSNFRFNVQSSLITPAHPREAGSEFPEGKIRRQQKFHSSRLQL